MNPRPPSDRLLAVPVLCFVALALGAAAAPLAAREPSAPSIAPGRTLRFPRAGGVVVADAPPAVVERTFFPVFGIGPSVALTNDDAAFDTGEKLARRRSRTRAWGARRWWSCATRISRSRRTWGATRSWRRASPARRPRAASWR